MAEPVFPFRPNWRTPVVERLEWLTDVHEAKDLTESRIQLRAFPRRYLEYELLESGYDAARLDALLWGWQAKQFTLPVWTDPQKLTASLPAGSTSIAAETEGFDFYAGGKAVLWQSEQNYEAVDIDSIETDTAGDTFLALAVATTESWPAGTRLFPARLSRLQLDLGVQHTTSTIVGSSLRFELDNTESTATADTTTYRGTEVNERRPNWLGGIEQNYSRKAVRHDYQLGAVQVDDLADLPIVKRTHRHLLDNRSEIADYRAWLHARAGRFNPFWQPQWQRDLVLVDPIGPTDDTITIKDLNSTASYNLDPGRQDIALRHRNGTWYYRRVDSIAAGGEGEEVLTLDSALGISAAPEDFTVVTWLMLSRFEADAIELAWYTAGIAESAVEIRSVRA